MERKKFEVVSTNRSMPAEQENSVKALYPLSGKETLDRILDHPKPRALVRGLAQGDFYWLIKKIGEGDCLPVLELASTKQWQYLLDMEIWRKDRMDLSQADRWLSQILKADPSRLVKWLFSSGQSMTFYYLFRSIQVEIPEEDEDQELPDGFFTLDGTYYIRVVDPDLRENIEGLLRWMAREDELRYQAVVQGLAGVVPAEAEEEMYRLRGVRLAEHGFLPFEEALSVYGPLNCEILTPEKEVTEPAKAIDRDSVAKELIPLSPFYHLGRGDLLMKVVAGSTDPLFQDRIYLEFAGLCNQILSADGSVINDLDVLVKTCRRAAGFLNLTLEKVCNGDVSSALDLLKRHPLITVFRAGFGLVLGLKWELEKWIKDAWFLRQGLDVAFWGEVWGQTLKGLSLPRPLLYRGHVETEAYRDFKSLSELEACRDIFDQVKAMDRLFEKLGDRFHLTEEQIYDPEMRFHPLLFNLWSRKILGLPLSFEGLLLEQAKTFFVCLRAGEKSPPYRMPGFENIFVSDMIRLASASEMEKRAPLKAVLRNIWGSFSKEYLYVSAEDLDQRYSSFIIIKSVSS
ncbi:MAG: DUF6178 family protein [Desulfatiglandaceae bacterium]